MYLNIINTYNSQFINGSASSTPCHYFKIGLRFTMSSNEKAFFANDKHGNIKNRSHAIMQINALVLSHRHKKNMGGARFY